MRYALSPQPVRKETKKETKFAQSSRNKTENKTTRQLPSRQNPPITPAFGGALQMLENGADFLLGPSFRPESLINAGRNG